MLREPKLLKMNYHTHKNRTRSENNPCISKMEWVATILVSKVEAISQIFKIVNFQNITDFSRFIPIFFMLGEINLYSWLHIHNFKLCPVPHTMNLSGSRMPWQIGLSQADFGTTQPQIIPDLFWLWQHEVIIKCRPIHGVWQQQDLSRKCSAWKDFRFKPIS